MFSLNNFERVKNLGNGRLDSVSETNLTCDVMSDENQQVDIEDDENSPEELENPTQQTEDHDSANSGEDSSSPQSQTDEHVDPSDDATGNLFPEVQSDEESSIEPRTSEPRFFVFVEHYGAVGHVVDEQFDELESNGG